jgi:hypothetical protein
VGRGLSDLQKKILAIVDHDGCIESWEAQSITFEFLPKRKQRMKETSSAKPRSEWGKRNRLGIKRLFTPSEKRDASVAASASRALTRLCKRGLLEQVFMGHIQVSDSAVHSERWLRIPPFYTLTDQGRLSVKANRSADGLNR